MAGASPTLSNSPAQQALPTPSPFSFSAASTAWSSRPPIHISNLLLRSLALLFSFVSALALAAAPASSPKRYRSKAGHSFHDYPEFMYLFIVNILIFLYSACQLFKGICDIAHRGILISEMTADYLSFILDQMAGYLLISSSSVIVRTIQLMNSRILLRKAAVVSVCMSFAAFLVIAACAFLSGYKLCKRIVW